MELEKRRTGGLLNVIGKGWDRWVVECSGRGRIGRLLNGIEEEEGLEGY